MPKRMQVSLTAAEAAQLKRWEKNPPKPYLRDRARAILRVAQGEPMYKVARSLRTPVQRGTVREWVVRFAGERCAGLKIRAGRGRKPVFSPSASGSGPSAP
jgi:transposase